MSVLLMVDVCSRPIDLGTFQHANDVCEENDEAADQNDQKQGAIPVRRCHQEKRRQHDDGREHSQSADHLIEPKSRILQEE
jgi:hypothetical protein